MFTLGVGPVFNNGAGSSIAVVLNGTTAGRQLIVGATWTGNVTLDSVACTDESNLTLHTNATIPPNFPDFATRRVQLASLADNEAGGDKTFTFNFSGAATDIEVFAIEFAGGDTLSFFDNVVSASDLFAGTPTVSLTPANDNSLIVALMRTTSGTPTEGAGYTLIDLVQSGRNGEYDLDAGAAGARAVDFTAAGGGWVVTAAAFNVQQAAEATIDATFGFESSGHIGHLGQVRKAFDATYAAKVVKALEVDSRGMVLVRSAADIVYAAFKTVRKAFVVSYAIEAVNRLRKFLDIGYELVDLSALVVTTNPTVTINGRTLVLEAAGVNADEGQYAWTCDLTLQDVQHYALFNRGDEFTVNLGGEEYSFIVDTKQFSRNADVDMSATITGISPSAQYSDTGSERITKTWPATTVKDVVEELFGAGVVQWEILNWSLPANVLAVNDQSPIAVLQLLARAAGGVVESDPDGTLRVRYSYPVSVQHYASATADQQYTDSQHTLDANDRTTQDKVVNRIRILDGSFNSQGDSMSFEQSSDNPVEGTVKVVPQPWRTGLEVSHTSRPSVSVAAQGVDTEEFEETVEVIGGHGSLANPIHEILETEWLYTDLGAISFDSDRNEFQTAVAGESLVRVVYTTRFFKYKARAFEDAKVQFLAKEEAGGATGSAVDIVVQRGAGDQPGADIVDNLIRTLPVALQRGRNELDEQAHAMLEVDTTAVYRTGVRCGQLAQFVDFHTGQLWRGKITSVGHTVNRTGAGGVELTTSLRIKRPTL